MPRSWACGGAAGGYRARATSGTNPRRRARRTKPAIVEAHEALARAAASPVQRIREIQTATVEIDGILYRFPPLHRDMRYAQQVLDSLAEGLGLELVEAAHDPFELKHDAQRHIHSGRLEHNTTGNRALALGLRVLRIVAVEAGQDVRVERDHALPRFCLSRSAGSNSDSRRTRPRRGLTLIIP